MPRKGFAMSHDKIKAAARKRMARTGESYAVARLAVIQEAQQRARSLEPTRTKALEDVRVGLARYGQHVRAQLSYPSGLAEIQRRFTEALNAPAPAQAAQHFASFWRQQKN
jgi:hypothetical protein